MSGRVDAALAALTLDEKAALLAGADAWHTVAVPRIGLGAIRLSDGPAGVRGTTIEGDITSALFPSPISVAATADPGRAEAVGAALGAEAKAKGVHVLLAPTINLVRHPLGGRNFECFGEDPELAADLAAAFVTGVQSQGVAACPKHLVANDQETDRLRISAVVDEVALRSLYLRPFHAAMADAGAWTCMAAYNRLNAVHCTEHPWLLTTVLRREWGWDGVVISDWGAVHSTVPSVAAGCDLLMPGPSPLRGESLARAVESGELDEDTIDRSVHRLLVLAERVGVLGQVACRGAAEQSTGTEPPTRALLRDVARAGIVRMHDRGCVLPLARGATVAAIGPHAGRLHAGGGGSASLNPPFVVSPVDGLRAAGVQVVFEPGCEAASPHHPTSEGGRIWLELLDENGDVVRAGALSRARWFAFAPAIPPALRLTTQLMTDKSGLHQARLDAVGQASVTLDGVLVWEGVVAGRQPVELDLVAGSEHVVMVEHRPARPGFASCELRLAPPPDPSARKRAVAAAREADAAVVIIGLDAELDTEGHDRESFALPHDQVELARAVAAAQPVTVVVVNAGAPVDLSWADDIPCLLWLPPPGQEGGHALADVLLGVRPATGRLPFTIPRWIDDVPAHPWFPGDGTEVVYGEGTCIGLGSYRRRGVEPLYPFGHMAREAP